MICNGCGEEILGDTNVLLVKVYSEQRAGKRWQTFAVHGRACFVKLEGKFDV